MTRSKEEAIAAGVKIAETKHSMKRRKPWHDYFRKGTYMLTLSVEGRQPLLGKLVTIPSADVAGELSAQIALTALGQAIRAAEVQKITAIYKKVEVWKLCIMPDHIHMIVRVREDLPKGKSGACDWRLQGWLHAGARENQCSLRRTAGNGSCLIGGGKWLRAFRPRRFCCGQEALPLRERLL